MNYVRGWQTTIMEAAEGGAESDKQVWKHNADMRAILH